MAVSKPPIIRNGRKITEDIVVKGVKNTETVRNIYKIAGKKGQRGLKHNIAFLVFVKSCRQKR